MIKPRVFIIISMIALAAISRLIPHPPNFTPITAMALFAGAHFTDKRLAFVVPLVAMFLSDLIIGLHSLIPVTYGTFALITGIGFWLRSHRSVTAVFGATFISSLLFFLLTNLGVWALGSLYPRTLEGLVTCYIAAIPFFKNTLLGDGVYVTVMFGSFALAEKRFPLLQVSR